MRQACHVHRRVRALLRGPNIRRSSHPHSKTARDYRGLLCPVWALRRHRLRTSRAECDRLAAPTFTTCQFRQVFRGARQVETFLLFLPCQFRRGFRGARQVELFLLFLPCREDTSPTLADRRLQIETQKTHPLLQMWLFWAQKRDPRRLAWMVVTMAS